MPKWILPIVIGTISCTGLILAGAAPDTGLALREPSSPVALVRSVSLGTPGLPSLDPVTEYQRATEQAHLDAVEAARVAAEAEAQRLADEAAQYQRDLDSRRANTSPAPKTGISPAGCTGNYVIPEWIVIRESGCDPNAVNSSSGAYGLYQIMPMHWAPGGVCDDLAARKAEVSAQNECAWRLSKGGTSLGPWGG